MHHSRSFRSYGSSTVQTEETLVSRPRARSSLDTFLIPGRVRVPSRKPDAADFQITQGLLHQGMPIPPNSTRANKPMPQSESHPQNTLTVAGLPKKRSASKQKHRQQQPIPVRVRPQIAIHSPPRFGGREVIVVPHQRSRKESQQGIRAFDSDPQHASKMTYDGADETDGVVHIPSRMTSMTWSTLSHRVFTNSSGSSRHSGALRFREEYNQLAEKHGLRHMAEASSEDEDKTKVATKAHQHSWLARKLFRRSSSTYTLKAKTTYKPLTRKKSLGGLPLLVEAAPKNILKDKSLEEISRLGGLGILVLPHDFAVNKLTLPTSLSATATYLCQYGESPAAGKPSNLTNKATGRNAPGVFRVSGQTTTISALYDFYDHQFSQAGSPSKVEETVGSGLLPAHLEYTVNDVASLFKKILIGLPGGLLGSLELFEALRDILLNLSPDPGLSDSGITVLRAKLIALAISSVSSAYRVYLIQAIVGLVAYLGHEAERAKAEMATVQAEAAASNGPEQPTKPTTDAELMGYQSLGVVFGPLLLGDLTDKIDSGGRESQEDTSHPSSEGAKKSKKQKRIPAPNKLERDANISTHVDRAKVISSMIQLLLVIWKDVVIQLREINNATMSPSWRSTSQIEKIPSHTSRLTMNSEEDRIFLDVLRGRKLPGEFGGDVTMKRKVRISSRSPMSRSAVRILENYPRHPSRTWLPLDAEQHYHKSQDHIPPVGPAVQDNWPFSSEDPFSHEGQETSTEDVARLEDNKHTQSDIAMDKLAMGTILSRPEDSPTPSQAICRHRHASSTEVDTPRMRGREKSNGDAPETVVKLARSANGLHTLQATRPPPSLDKPLPTTTGMQMAQLSPPSKDEDAAGALRQLLYDSRPLRRSEDMPSHSVCNLSPRALFPTRRASPRASSFPPRQSSLPQDNQSSRNRLETYESVREYRARSEVYMAPPSPERLRKTSDAQNEDELPPVGEKRNSVKFLAQQFTESSKADRKEAETAKDKDIATVYTHIRSLPSPDIHPLEDPFTTTRTPSPEKDSLIPKPVHVLGRGRRAESRSPSPPKSASPKSPNKRPSVYQVLVRDRDAEIVKKSSEDLLRIKAKDEVSPEHPDNTFRSIDHALFTRPVSTFIMPEPLTFPSRTLEAEPIEHLIPKSLTTLSRSDSPSRSTSPNRLNGFPGNDLSTRTDTYLNAGDGLKPIERQGSMNNATLYREICRLQRQAREQEEETKASKRELAALRDTYKESGRAAREEAGRWKRRAQLAEDKLKGMGGLAGFMAGVVDMEGEDVVSLLEKGEDAVRKTRDSAIKDKFSPTKIRDISAKSRDSRSGNAMVEKWRRADGMEVEVRVWKDQEEEEKELQGMTLVHNLDGVHDREVF